MHPSHDDLQNLLLGTLTEQKVEPVLQHVQQCPHCEDTMRELETMSDEFVHQLRQPTPTDPFAHESNCHQLVAAIKEIGRDTPTSNQATDKTSAGASELGVLGKYPLIAKLGQGGMGTVYRSLHPNLKRPVALKVLPAERLKDANAISRFEREMEAVGGLAHPNFVAAHDAGEANGTHFLVMELVDGVDLSSLVRRIGPLDAADACELVRQAAVGLAHAHRREMVHRDIKPSNLMLARTEDGDAIVKILDMGLALLNRATEQGDLTSTGQMMGTLDYMAPEQGTDIRNVDIRADIYALGATLYKLLCAEPLFPPQTYETPLSLMMAKASQDAPSIAQKRSDLDDELVAIVDRMLARDPDDRFATPDDLVAALQPFAAGANLRALLDASCSTESGAESDTESRLHAATQSDVAGGPRALQTQTETLGRSHESPDTEGRPAVGAVAGSGDLATTSAPAPATAPADQARRSRGRVIAIAASLAGIVLLGIVLTFSFKDGRVVVSAPDGELPEDMKVVLQNAGKPITISAENKWSMSVSPGDYNLSVEGGNDQFDIKQDRVTVSRFGRTLLTIERNSVVAKDGDGVTPSTPKDGLAITSTETSPFDNLRREDIDPYELTAAGWGDAAKAPDQLVAVLGNSRFRSWAGRIFDVSYSPDGKRLLGTDTDDASSIVIWNADSGHMIRRFIAGITSKARFVANGERIVALTYHGELKVFDAANGEEVRSNHLGLLPSDLRLDPHGRLVATATQQNEVKLFNAENGKLLYTFDGRDSQFTPDGSRLVVVQSDAVKIFDIKSGGEETASYDFAVKYIGVSPDGQRIVGTSSEKNELALIWDAGSGKEVCRLNSRIVNTAYRLEFSPDGKTLVVGGAYGFGLFNSESGEAVWQRPELYVSAVGFRPDGSRLAFGGYNGIGIVDAATGEEIVADERESYQSATRSIALSRDEKLLAIARADGTVHVVEIPTFRVLRTIDAFTYPKIWDDRFNEFDVAFDPDSKTIAVASRAHDIRLFDVTSGEKLKSIPHRGPTKIAFTPDGKHVVAGSLNGGSVILWDVEATAEYRRFPTSNGDAFAVSPDGKQIAVVGDGTIDLYDIASRKQVATIENENHKKSQALKFCDDGRSLFFVDKGDSVIRWDIRSGQSRVLCRERRDTSKGLRRIKTVDFHTDSGTLIVGGRSITPIRLVNLTDGSTYGLPGIGYSHNDARVQSVQFSRDGRHLIALNGNGTIYVLRLASLAGESE